MAENQGNENAVPDSQETYYDKSQNIMESQMLNESQDFALIVGEDSDESTKNQTQAVENIGDLQADANIVEKNAVEHADNNDAPITHEIAKETENINQTKEDALSDSLKMDDEKSKERRGSDEDEIIQGTPPDVSSPSRKLLSGKRKGESIDEPVAKVQRTLSQSDALTLDKEKIASLIGKESKDNKLIAGGVTVGQIETQSDQILCDNTENFHDKEDLVTCTNQIHGKHAIIEETQDPQDSEPILLCDKSKDENGDGKNEPKESVEMNETPLDQYSSQFVTASSKPNLLDNENGALLESERDDPQPREKISSDTCDVEMTVSVNEKCGENIIEDIKTGEEVKSTDGKDVSVGKGDKEFLNAALPSSDSTSDSNCEGGSNGSNKSRKSIEVIFDRKSSGQENKKFVDLVKIDEDGEEIILDSSNDEIVLHVSSTSSTNSPQNTTVYKSCVDSKSNSESSYKSTAWNETHQQNDAIEISDCQITNGDEDLTMSGTTKTVSVESDSLIDDVISDSIKTGASKSVANDSFIDERFNLSTKLSETMELANVVSDSDGDSLVVNENTENVSQDKACISENAFTGTKTTTFERKTRFQIELKYLVHVDDATKEIVCKEVMDVQCEPIVETSCARRSSDASGCLADLSGNANKDTSPGSVLSNPQLFQLPLSRISIASTTSSSSSVSSAASLAAKLFKDNQFSLPKGRAKHAKRPAIEAISEEKVTQGWKNASLITDALLQSANMVITSPEIFQHDTELGKSEDKVLSSTPEPGSTDDRVLSSTPEPVQDEKVSSQVATPKSTKDKKTLKRIRTKSSNNQRSNGMRKASPELITTSQENRLPIHKRQRENNTAVQSDKLSKQTANVSTPSRLRPQTPRLEALTSLTPQNSPIDKLVGKIVFAKWSDNNYYPGEVTEKTKGKFRVKFYDGGSKLIIEEFIIPMPDCLREGLSVYATTKDDEYASMGIIVASENVNNVIYYTVDVDNGKRVRVEIKDIFLMPTQAQYLKEKVEVETKSLPKTPQHLGQISLDNLVDGKRRSRRPTTPNVTTPKSRKGISPKTTRMIDSIPASGSGIPKVKGKVKEVSSSESETKTSDSNVSSIEDVDGVQPELTAMPVVQISKGPSSRMKGRGRSKSKQIQDDAELGPIPPPSSTIFKNMSFILSSTSSDIISRHNDDSCSEAGTEYEEEWLSTPFIKERVKSQLINGGGTVYDSFKLIPPNEYKNTKLITNAPNLTAKSIQCLSVGIPAYNHTWVIHSCRENKALKPASSELPAGWSLEKKMYIESHMRPTKQPFTDMIIGMPTLDNRNVASQSIQFWRRICENAGAVVQLIDDSETDFSHVTAILTDNRCPSWLVEKADSWQIPLVSTVYIIQCIIAGQSLIPDAHPQYKHTFIQS